MTAVFLDTSGWFAALSPREAKHDAAFAAYRQWIEGGARLVTTNLVVAEMQTLVMRYRGSADALRFLDSLHRDATHEVVYVDRDTERAAIDQWMRRYRDQRLSLTDAASFEVMRIRRIRQALAIGEHFTLAGFEAVP